MNQPATDKARRLYGERSFSTVLRHMAAGLSAHQPRPVPAEMQPGPGNWTWEMVAKYWYARYREDVQNGGMSA